jgi:SAM-dependent methyltransferase
MTRVAIVGGGPGGLFTASLLEEYCGDLCQITLFEAGPCLGGKVRTQRFETAPVLYEAGVAELYDYSHFGPDPLKQMVARLGLTTVPMTGLTVILGNTILSGPSDIRRHLGPATLQDVQAFQRRCSELCSSADYYEGHWQDDNRHPWADKTFREVLDEIPDAMARKYIEVAVRSDLATEPHLTSALNGLKNVLMDDPRYLQLYSIEGGIQRLVDDLAARLTSQVVLQCPVIGVGKNSDNTWRVTTRRDSRVEEQEFDLVVLALPNYWLQRLEWADEDLRRAMQRHLAHYDRPAHYLRISVLFQQPFWRSQVSGSYFMTDAFGGGCVYDEGTRHPCDPYGVLGWLIAGNDALALSNYDDDRLIDMALDSLPEPLAKGCKLFQEGRVHRWIGTISAEPGGKPVRSTRERHLPDPHGHPGLFLVGDYLFDSTLNGAYDSADFVTDMMLTVLRKKKYSPPVPIELPFNGNAAAGNGAAHPGRNGIVPKEYHDLYDGERPYEESFKEYFCERYTIDLIRAIWGWSPPYRLLDCGSASGLTLEAFAKVGVDAWGVENSKYIHSRTPARWRKRNLLGDVRELPFPDSSFDFVYDTCLCHVPSEDLEQAIRELFRVCRVGVFHGGYTSDMTVGVIEAYDIFEDVASMFTLWEWSELFLSNGFRLATSDQKLLARAWKIETDANEGDVPWYPDPESMRYCFYSKPDAPAPPARKKRRRATSKAR